MEIIKSPENNQVKAVAKLKDRKYRQISNRYVIEGYRNVKDSLQYLSNPVVYLSESGYEKFADEFEGAIVCSDSVFDKMCDTKSSQGVIAVADIEEKPFDLSKNCIFLDRLADPGNVGTIMRSCIATEFENVINYSGVDAFNPKTVRSAMSAACKLNVKQTNSLSVLEELKKEGYYVLCADMGGESVYETDLSGKKLCLVIGNEANGVCDEVVALSDKVISLPMGKVESLNAAVCASILMYTLKYGK